MPWIYLLVASLFQIAWTFSLKYMDMKKIIAIRWLHFFDDRASTLLLLPFIGNTVFGLVNIYCFSIALKSIPTGTALAVWMGITIIGVKVIDIGLLKQPFQLSQMLFLLLILVGIVGLKSGG
ncbi:MAG: hypothetical protein H7334_10470 [Ferruginibacter sp.]|nr:hypothetical protein [Ferruginibacter sp.]